MPAALAPEVLTGPIGVLVDLVVGQEPSLDRAAVTEVVENLAGGRAKRRRLAQALLDRPTVLSDGQSPAPRAESAARCENPARHAATSGASAAVIARIGPDARNAHPTTDATPWI